MDCNNLTVATDLTSGHRLDDPTWIRRGVGGGAPSPVRPDMRQWAEFKAVCEGEYPPGTVELASSLEFARQSRAAMTAANP